MAGAAFGKKNRSYSFRVSGIGQCAPGALLELMELLWPQPPARAPSVSGAVLWGHVFGVAICAVGDVGWVATVCVDFLVVSMISMVWSMLGQTNGRLHTGFYPSQSVSMTAGSLGSTLLETFLL